MKNDKIFYLKTPIEIGRMTKDEKIDYIDKLHNIIKIYQVAINVIIDKNQNVR